MQAHHADPLFQESLPTFYLYCEGDAPLIFTENETNHERHLWNAPNASPYVKDGINNFVVYGQTQKRSTRLSTGTKAAAHYRLTVGAGATHDGAPASDYDSARQSRRALCGVRRHRRRTSP
jgi:hypothetical protein